MVWRQEVLVVTAVFFASMSVGVSPEQYGETLMPNKLQQYLPSDLKNKAKTIVGSIVVARIYALATRSIAATEIHKITCNCRPVSLSLMLIVMHSLKNMKLGEYGGAQTEEKEHFQVAENEIEKDRA
ncbi:hypothetical protein N7467_006858 [Penicillium canescens]|nr:hypothetical protein N7467_006858 [Penicillium canescens]